MFRNSGTLLWLIGALLTCGAFYFWSLSRRKKFAALLGREKTISQLVPPELALRRKIKFALQTSALFFLFVALAGPQWGVELVATQAATNQAIVAVDTSLSMTAEDIRPSRLEKAKSELSLILEQMKGNRVGVIAFAGEAAVLCPVTTDVDAAKQILGDIQPGAIPQPGTAIGKAIRLAAQTLSRYPGGKALVILSDGEDHKTDPLGAAEEAASLGIKIYSIGIGSTEGEPIPLKDASGAMTGYKKDRKGATVISRLGEQTLKDVALRTGGAYYRSSPGENEAQEIIKQILSLEKASGVSGASNQYKNRFMIPLALGFFLLILEISLPLRSRKIGRLLPVLLAALLSRPANAATGEGALRKGNRLYEAEQYEPAVEQYSIAGKKKPKDPRPVFNVGDALYKLEAYDQAEEAFTSLTHPSLPAGIRSSAHYNLGNVHFQKQEFDKAIGAYRQALSLNPQDAQTKNNLAIALRMLKNPPPKKKDKNKDDKKNQKPPEDKKDDKSQSQRQKQDQGGQPPQPKTRPQDQISREDAQRILRAVAEKEKSTQKQVQKKPVENKPPDVEEDW